MGIVLMAGTIILISLVIFKFLTKGKPSYGEDYTPASNMYSGKTRDYSTHPPAETHRKAPYEEVERKQ